MTSRRCSVKGNEMRHVAVADVEREIRG